MSEDHEQKLKYGRSSQNRTLKQYGWNNEYENTLFKCIVLIIWGVGIASASFHAHLSVLEDI